MKDVATDGSGNLYFWLPEDASTSIAVSDGSTLYEYSAVAVTKTNSNTQTLAAGSGDVTLYAVTYDGNSPGGGSAPLDNTQYLTGAQVRVSGNTGSLTKTGYGEIAGTGLSGTVQPNSTFTMPASAVTLTAVWKSTDATITGYDLGGVTTGTLGIPAATPGGVTTAGAVTLTSAEATNATFSATTTDGNATVQYATGATPTFGAWVATTIADGDNVWIEVTAEDGTVLVYKIVVTVTPPPAYSISVGSFTGGSVGTNQTSATAGATVTLTVYPASGYELSAISVFNTGDATVAIPLNGFNGFNGLNGSFTMPAYDVTVSASFTEIPPPEPDPDAVALDAMIYSIRSLHVIVPQEEANTESDAVTWLKTYLARLFQDKGWDISVQKLTVVNFFPATAGTRTDVPGTNGSFSFFAILRKGYVTDRTYNMDGTIAATPYTISTGNESAEVHTSVYLHNHTLYICSPAAETVEVYSFTGAKLFSAKKDAGEAVFTVPTNLKAVIVRGSSGWTRRTINN